MCEKKQERLTSTMKTMKYEFQICTLVLAKTLQHNRVHEDKLIKNLTHETWKQTKE